MICKNVCSHWRELIIEYSYSWKLTSLLENVKCDSVKAGAFFADTLELASETIETMSITNIEADARFFKSFSLQNSRTSFPSLSKICLSGTKINSIQAKSLILKCNQLKEVSLKNCPDVDDLYSIQFKWMLSWQEKYQRRYFVCRKLASVILHAPRKQFFAC